MEWIDEAERELVICRDLSLARFEALTPREVQWRLDAIRKQDEQEWQRTAHLASWVLQSLGMKVTANDLLGNPTEPQHWARAFM